MVPRGLGLGDARADPALVLLDLFMASDARRAACRTGAVLTYEKLLDEHGREMHRSWGNAILADEAFDRMGADVMRWMFCEPDAERRTSASATGRRTRSSGGC